MKLFLTFAVLISMIILFANYDPIFATHMGSHHDEQMDSQGMTGQMMSNMAGHHMSFNGMCAPGFAPLDGICVLDDRCGPGAYPGKVCMMDGILKQYLRPHHQKYAGISVDSIICAEGKELMFKHHNASPACVNSQSIEKLKHRGWQTEKPVIACTMEYNPVCGLDDITYGNMCGLNAQHMAMKNQGECMKVSETTILYVDSKLVDCVGVGPQQCMLIKQDPDSEWQMFYDTIEGFDFQEGANYQLNVTITEIKNPPADSSSLKYTLIETLVSTSEN